MSISKERILEYKKNFGLRVRELRESKGFSQLDLASEINVEKTSISRIENGRTNVTLVTAVKLANALGVELKNLFEF
ncbi:helix-turn-helix domain-containing protein [Leptobacterium flavescens]|uniref:Helix-turn-helix domain-containing protein n=1 Tax=Leptobacterium flavescens TaxID=472055 RepID=A0A6P0URC7_9FLAO|nr:helix-turn-helix transcriptional regulator [Leptobacterium flavescens]NER15102.1 helix-turn-helix domain-containing protein [Leptobacterium flavescens]